MEFNTEIDTLKYAEVLRQFPSHIEYALTLDSDIEFSRSFDKIVFIGMGGSAFVGRFLQEYLRNIDIPIHVISDFSIPKYVNKNSLVIAISYSGNTEETIDAYRQAAQRKASIVSMSSGGKLETLAPMYENPFIKLPSGLQPRQTFCYMLIPLLKVFERNSIITDHSESIKNIQLILKKDMYETYAKDLVEKIGQSTPIIYGASPLNAVAYSWKTNFNENAKTHAFSNTLPECLHNELCPYEFMHDTYSIILSNKDERDRRVNGRVKLFKEQLKEENAQVVEIQIAGNDLLSQMVSSYYLGQWVSYYLALAKNRDPTPIKAIENFKQKSK